jgi:sulfatase maturation enzyme AslB (radical SAM superfamily)
MLDYPHGIHIETTGRCNAHCKYCPHDKSPRKNMDMSDKLFNKIVRELKVLPPVTVSMMKLGEPFLDPKICERLQAVDQLDNIAIEIHTNLSILTPEILETLTQMKNLRQIWVSMNWMDKDTYHEQMGLSFENTISNIRKLYSVGLAAKIVIGRVNNDPKWHQWVVETFPHVNLIGTLRQGSWCGHVEAENILPHRIVCPRLYDISICCDGKVALCCMDGLCEYELGDVNTQTMLEVFNSEKAKKYRTTPRAQIEPCKDCSFE